jgi:hypothetical protein
MSIKKLSQNLLFIFGFIFLIASCEPRYLEFNKLNETSYNPNIAVPLFNARVGMQDILARNQLDVVQTDASGLITLVYQGGLIDVNIFDLLPPLTETMEFELGTGFPGTITFNQPGTLNFSDQVEIDYPAPDNQLLSEIKFKKGKLEIKLEPDFPGITPDIDLSLNLPGIEFADGSTYSYSDSISPSGVVIIDVDLAGGKIDFTKGAAALNKFVLDYSADINYQAGDQLGKNDKLKYSFTIKDIEFKHVIGDFGSQTLPITSDTINLSIFGAAYSNGDVRLTNPKLNVELVNGVGIPFRINFQKLYSKNIATGDTFPILFGNFQNPFPINSPVRLDDSVKTTIDINKDNTDIIEILSPTPKLLVYDIEGQVNPGPGPNYNFITDQSVFKVRANVEMPMEGYVNNFVIQDTVEFSVGQTLDELESATINVVVANGLPINVNLQLYLYNTDLDQILDSILVDDNTQIFKSGVPETGGKINQNTVEENIIQAILDQETAQNLVDANRIIIRAQLGTYDAPNSSIKLFDDYGIGIKLGLNLKGNISF